MSDYKTHDGREITFDLWKVSRGEFKGFFDPKRSSDADEIVIARAAGMSIEELQNLPTPDYNGLTKALIDKLSNAKPEEPTLDHPN